MKVVILCGGSGPRNLSIAQVEGRILVHGPVIEKVVSDHGPPIPETQDEFIKAVMRKSFDDMP